MKTQSGKLSIVAYLSAAMMLLAGAAIARADESPEPSPTPRISESSQGQGMTRGTAETAAVTRDEYEPLIRSGSRSKSTRSSGQQKLSGGEGQSGAQSPNTDFWIYDANVILFSDFDRDGYYIGIDLEFDADTIYSVADVYAVLYLSYNYGPWNEYASTEDFAIFGASGGDEYVIETELVSGYPTGEYDILIELFDAYDHSFVADMGPENTSELAFLPLEDAGRDAPGEVSQPVVVNHGGGGGATDVWTLATLVVVAAGSVFLRRRRLPCFDSSPLASCREPSA